jgi:hypothetical protein
MASVIVLKKIWDLATAIGQRFSCALSHTPQSTAGEPCLDFFGEWEKDSHRFVARLEMIAGKSRLP